MKLFVTVLMVTAMELLMMTSTLPWELHAKIMFPANVKEQELMFVNRIIPEPNVILQREVSV